VFNTRHFLRFSFPPLKTDLKNLILDEKNFVVGTILLALTVLLVIWLGTFTRIEGEKALTIESAVSDGNNIAAIVEANLNEVLDRATLYARRAQAAQAEERPAYFLHTEIRDDPAYLRAALFGSRGELLESSANRKQEPELERFILAAAAQPLSSARGEQLLIGHPSQSGSSSWRVPVLVRFSSQNEVRGYFVAIIDLGYLLRFYKDVKLGEGGRIEVLMRDGYQLAEINGTSLSGGIDYASTGYADFLSGSSVAGVIRHARPDASRSEVSVYRISQRYPFAIVISRDEGELIRQLTSRHTAYLLRAAIISIVLALLLLTMFVIALRQRRLYAGLAASEQEKKELIVQLEQEKGRALWQAAHDHLTMLPNRMRFYEMAQIELARARRSRNLYALLFLDLDKFKPINDTLGHAVGDLLLQQVGARLRSSLREYDLLARFGGDEFVMLIADVASEADIAKVAAKLVDAISQTYHDLEGKDVDVSPSIGIALYPRDGQNLDTLITHADIAMYMAKSAGAGTYRFFDASLNAFSAREVDLLAHFKNAIKRGEFRLHFQPRVSLDDYAVLGLKRWCAGSIPSTG